MMAFQSTPPSAMTATATDKIGRSVPAPGKGILTTAREHHGDLKYPNSPWKKRCSFYIKLKKRLEQIGAWEASEIEYLSEEAELAKEEFGADFSVSEFMQFVQVPSATTTGVASFHGTSTKANDKNESATINSMMKHLGRSEGNPVFGVFQKYLTGPGGAGA
ncbi:3-oxoacyl-[acyl-carrier-protein] synthase [Clavispora lusitaniae]|nr:3-oxoacyl-[acyl-carrier-protein] synthase [Clavispora lusitaniae]